MAELETVSYDQYKNIPSYEDLGRKVKIIFSDNLYSNIMSMSIDAIINNQEYSSFFLGRKISIDPEIIYFDYKTSDFEPAIGPR